MAENDLPVPPLPMLGIGRLGLGGGMTLKPRAKPEKITDYKIDQFLLHRGKNSSERLRELDKIRMYTPLPEEVELLNVTPYRMNLLVVQDVMYLCGGLVGVRFSSEELLELIRFTKGLASTWTEISNIFKDMSTSCKKLSLPGDDGSNSVELEQVRKLHQSADEYVTLFGHLQTFIREKQKGVDPSAKIDAPKLEADPESRTGRKLPQWLSILIEKHQASQTKLSASNDGAASSETPSEGAAPTAEPATDVTPAAAVSKVRSSQVKVGELSVYLSGCMTGVHVCNVEEQEAIAVLVQASNDTIMCVSNSEINTATATATDNTTYSHRSGQNSGSCTPRSRRYWARRFFNFLSKMTELAAAVKDEGALEEM